MIRHYTDDLDNPSWIVSRSGGQETTTRNAGLTGDGLGLTFTTAGGTTNAQLQLAGPRGDITTTVSLVAGQKAAGIDAWAGYTEYGIPEAGTASTQSNVKGVTDAGYGWLGSFERSNLLDGNR